MKVTVDNEHSGQVVGGVCQEIKNVDLCIEKGIKHFFQMPIEPKSENPSFQNIHSSCFRYFLHLPRTTNLDLSPLTLSDLALFN